jgi:hypothetical protein
MQAPPTPPPAPSPVSAPNARSEESPPPAAPQGFLNALGGVKLKPPAPKAPAPTPKPSSSEEMSEERKREIIEAHFEVNMDRWVERLAPGQTIPTVSRPLSIAQAQALIHLNKTYEKAQPTQEHATHLAELERQIDELIEQVDGHNNGCFVKLSCRSAKDASTQAEDTKQLFHSFVESELTEEERKDKNRLLCMLYKASVHAMKVRSAKQALDLMLTSRRILWDLLYDLEYPETFSNHVIVRKWENIDLEGEFRAFVYDGKMTAISQYYSQCYFPSIQTKERQQQLQELIISFWQQVKQCLPFRPPYRYVIDFAVIKTKKGNDDAQQEERVIVLEVNPFNISTGGSMFTWENERDSDILEGKLPFEFRVRTEPIAHALKNKLPPLWVSLLWDDTASKAL